MVVVSSLLPMMVKLYAVNWHLAWGNAVLDLSSAEVASGLSTKWCKVVGELLFRSVVDCQIVKH